MKQFQKLVFQPGINREGTNYSAEGFWWDCDRIRFRNGLPETIGGWVKSNDEQFLGECRRMLNWQSLAGNDYLALGTSKKLYIENNDAYNDITPIRSTVSENNPIATGAPGDSIVTVTTTASHGAVAGDYVTLSGAADTDGILAAALNVEFEILSVPTVTTFTVETGSPCTAGGVTGGGAGVSIAFQIGTGSDAGNVGSGWGSGPYSRDTWSSEYLVDAGSADSLRLWSLANYGEDLVATVRGGGIYYWDATGGLSARAVLLSSLGGASDVPDMAATVLVTQERHLVALGASDISTGIFDPLLIRWTDQEDLVDWTPTVTNTAGDFRLTSGSYIITGQITRDEILIWTDGSLHSMRYAGPPFVFDIRQIGDNTSLVGPNAVVTANNITYWMGRDKFYVYNGTSQTIPCSLRRHVFDDFNKAQAQQVYAGLNEKFSEIWWFYCSADSIIPDKYVAFDYVNNLWHMGNMSRTAWLNSTIRGQLLATGGNSLYVHESGIDDGSQDPPVSLGSYIESSDFDIQDGTSFYFIERVIPDMRFDNSTSTVPVATLTVQARDFPGQPQQVIAPSTVTRTYSSPVEQYTNEVWIRLRGRQASIKLQTADAGVAWQMGNPRLSVRTDGRR